MPSEKVTTTLIIGATDYQGNPYVPANIVSQYLTQTKLQLQEFICAFNATTIVWDPSNWTGAPFSAFKAVIFSICDVGLTPSTSTVPLEIELIPGYTGAVPTKSGLILTIPAGDWMKIPSNLSYRDGTNAYDQFTGPPTAVNINRIRARNKDAAKSVVLQMWMVDNS